MRESYSPAVFSDQPIREQLERILNSAAFANSGRLSRFLRFVVEQSLEGKAAELKEYVVGIEVYERKQPYDPRVDSIVRVEARRLRAKLKTYYETEGAADPVLIGFRAGSYAPVFGRRASKAANPPPGGLAMAVLPFENLSSDPEDAYFSDGLTDEMIHALSQTEGVRMVARSSVLRLKGERVDVRALGEMLGVKVVLGGSVRRDGERLRITVELINAGDGYQLWSRQFDARMTNVFQVQEGIASAVVDALRPGLSDMRKPRSEPEGFALEAYSMYVRGRQFWNSETLEGYGRAIGCFEDTIAEWPGYARAYSGLADSYAELVYAGVLHPGEGMPRARTSALKALELDDGLSEAYLSLAMVLGLFEWDWAGGELAFMRAVQHGNYSAAHRIYGLFLTAMGRFEQGMDQLETARKLDPLSPQVQTALGLAYYEQRRYDQAIRHLRTLVETSEASAIAHVFLGLSYVQNSSPADALETIEKAPLAGSPVIQGAAAQVLALAGRPDKARRTLEEIRGVGQLLYVTPVSFAMLDLALGDTESALSWLDEGYDQRAPCMLWLNVDPRYDRIRGHPRFIALMNQMRFPSFARAEAIHGAA